MADKWQNTPLDEIQFRRPEVIQWWGGITANSIHPIIRESPFFDHTSKNGLLWDQAQNDMRTWEVCTNRDAFETRLKSMNGVEYLIVGEPQKEADPVHGPDTGIWVIRKQDRRKRAGREDEVTVLATYYLVGENMYQAPSVYDIVGNHLLATMNSLEKFNTLANSLPLFTPALGYTYYPPAPSKPTVASQASLAQSSRESSITPAAQTLTAAAAASQNSTSFDSTANSTNGTLTQAPDPLSSFALYESFNMMIRYGDEYMDENPLRGEPGNFTFSSTKDRVRAKAAEAEAAKAREQEMAKKLEDARASAVATPFAGTATPEKVQSPISDAKPTIKRSKTGDRIKRRKSKVATSPTSPASPAVPSPMA
ncbi:hypothetical protein MBLNU459_g0925t1 [Dothideomycetes sp. NU459]